MDRAEAELLLKGLVEKVHSVDFSIVPGLWKVEVEGKGQRGSVYVDFSKGYVISGRILRVSDWSDVTDGSAPVEKKADPAAIPLDDALLLGSKSASTKAIVFTDPQCPYCVKFHAELKEVVAKNPDVAFYLKLFPLKSHPDAYRISRSVICSGSMELLEASFAGKPVPDPSCETDAVDRTLSLVSELGIRSTPTLVLPDGRILSGFKPAEKVLELMTAAPAKGN
jgi:thiol:disulfide interchange protein DsbC